MGLDVYLYHCEDREKIRAIEAQAEHESEAVWKRGLNGRRYEELNETEKETLRKEAEEVYKNLDCDNCGQHTSVKSIKMPSKIHPKHYFSIGYFRSSYNGSGINRVLSNIGLDTLQEIMGVSDGDYEVFHDWKKCLKNVDTVLKQYREHIASPLGRFGVIEVGRPFGEPNISTAEEAFKLFAKERESNRPGGFTSYSNVNGEFYHDGMKIHAIIPSSNRFVMSYLVYERETDDEGDFYLQALEIVKETCQYVLGQKDPENYYMHWSG